MPLDSLSIETLPIVEAELNYLAPMAERPRYYAYELRPDEPESNMKPEPHRVAIRDVRPALASFTLDVHGFGAVQRPSAVRDFADEDEIRRVYYPDSEALVKAVTRADRVFIFDHTVRRHIPGSEDRRAGVRQPSRRVHVDHTEKSGPERVRAWLPDDVDALLRGRVQVINLWRPIHHPVYDTPLAVADARSVAPHDLVPSDLVYRHRTGETYSVRYNPAHRWFYLSNMTPDEGLLLKCYDSKTDGRARFAPHTAFNDPAAPAGAPPRESIELRTLVFHAT
ncbi:MAG: methyltransferase [Alphaproteobacteria bacterium]|nr:methyltransferase [Alphaproteobacteria bacterium]